MGCKRRQSCRTGGNHISNNQDRGCSLDASPLGLRRTFDRFKLLEFWPHRNDVDEETYIMKQNQATEATRREAQLGKLGTKQLDPERLRKAIRFLDEPAAAIILPRSNT
jgi:hypothetical protein